MPALQPFCGTFLRTEELAAHPEGTANARIFWRCLAYAYVGSLSLNAIVQTQESWQRYPFELTTLGGWITLIQHFACHPHRYKIPWQYDPPEWMRRVKRTLYLPRCLRCCSLYSAPGYTPAVGFSNLTLVLEMLIGILYWALGSPLKATVTTGPTGVNSILMHGGLAAGLVVDACFNRRPFYLKPVLCHVTLFLLCFYAPWNLVGQAILGDTIYPHMDLRTQVDNLFIALGIALLAGIFIAAGIGVIPKLHQRCSRAASSAETQHLLDTQP